MPLPEQVQRQVDEAEQRMTQLTGVGSDADETENASAVSDAPVGDTPPADNVVSLPTQGAPTDQPTPSQGSSTPAAGDTQYQELLQRYRSLQGMFNSLDAKYRETSGHLDGMRSALSTLQSRQPAVEPINATTGVSAKEQTDYTPEFFDMLSRWLDGQLGVLVNRVTSLEQHIVQRVAPTINALSTSMGTVAQQQTQTAEQRFFDALSAQIPNWERVNQPDGLQWLKEVDPMTGVSRQAYLDDARAKLDVARTMNIIRAFLASVNAGTSEHQLPAASASGTAHKRELERQVTPSTGRRTGPNTAQTAQERTYTKADLDKLYTDYRRGTYKGREAEFRKLEEELLAAINSGRFF